MGLSGPYCPLCRTASVLARGNQAFDIYEHVRDCMMTMNKQKNKAAAALGRKGGKAKVPKGFAMMDPEKRSEAAKTAAAKRWGNPTAR